MSDWPCWDLADGPDPGGELEDDLPRGWLREECPGFPLDGVEEPVRPVEVIPPNRYL